MVNRFFLGIDLGTSSVKLFLTDGKGTKIGEADASYPMYGRESGFFEQKPFDWISAIVCGLSGLREGVPQILWDGTLCGIGLSGQMPTLVLMEPDGRVLGNAIVWCDNRAQGQGERLLALWGAKRHYEKTGVFLDGRYLLPMHLWIKETRPELLPEEYFMLSAKDYLYYWLCGEIATDPSTASGYGVYDLMENCWDTALCREAGLDRKHLPRLTDSFDSSQCIREDAAKQLGIPVGVRIVCGGADSVCGVLGMGGTQEGTVCQISGSSTAILGIRGKMKPDDKNRFL